MGCSETVSKLPGAHLPPIGVEAGPGNAVVRPTWLQIGKKWLPLTPSHPVPARRAMVALESDWAKKKIEAPLHTSYVTLGMFISLTCFIHGKVG